MQERDRARDREGGESVAMLGQSQVPGTQSRFFMWVAEPLLLPSSPTGSVLARSWSQEPELGAL